MVVIETVTTLAVTVLALAAMTVAAVYRRPRTALAVFAAAYVYGVGVVHL